MDFLETMKNVITKGMQQTSISDMPAAAANMSFAVNAGYVTEKLYMILQIYLQNKGWTQCADLLQSLTDAKDSQIMPSATYFQMMTQRVTLDSQGRLILRENGKIILPFEHFANAVMLKHMNGPHGLHLGLDPTVRAVMESYTIGRENFGMEKEFIIEVVENCPNPACRYFKNHLEMTQKTIQHLATPTYLSNSQTNNSEIRNNSFNSEFPIAIPPPAINPHLGLSAIDLTGQSALDNKASLEQQSKVSATNQQQITAAIIQQQNRAIAQQNIEKLNANFEKQRQQLQLQQQLDMVKSQKAHFEPPIMEPKLSDFLRANLDSFEGFSASNKDLLALHNGAWATNAPGLQNAQDDKRNSNSDGGQEKIIRSFSDVMKNMQRMKTYVRPAMCKPYGKQSEALQKTLMDTIQIVQTLRSFLPPSHIQVSSWKNEDKHRYEET